MLLSVMPACRIFSFDVDDAFGVRKRKRTEENAVDQAEDGGIGADAERERDNGDGGKAFVLQKHANAVTNVVKQRVHDSLGVNAEVWGAHACSVLAIAFCDREIFRNTTEGIETERKVRLGRMPRPTRCKRVLPGIRIERAGFCRRERDDREQ